MPQKFTPKALNLELTTACPLRCPQCYCTLEGGRHLDPETAKNRLKEAAALGVKGIHLSGGETMCYPYLYEILECAAANGIAANVAISGYKFNSDVLSRLISGGVSGIFISLNGSTKEINSITRDGYDLAISALTVLRDNHFENSYINWVMHSNNAADFENMVRLAEEYRVGHLVVLSFKPDSKHHLDSFPSAKQIVDVANFIKSYSGPVQLMVETCFSQMLAVIRESNFFGNLNRGMQKGCGAGRWSMSISVDGQFTPCRHLDYFEKWDSIEEYWNRSPVLEKLRSIENDTREPCDRCKYGPYCRHCQAINSKLHGELYIGHEKCGLYALE